MSRSRLIGIASGVIVVIAVMSFTGPRPQAESSGEITRVGGTCLQLEQWGLFGWVIVGQAYSELDVTGAEWRSPPSSNPPCDDTPEAEYNVRLPADAVPDVYRVCGLADEGGCLEFRLVRAAAAPEP